MAIAHKQAGIGQVIAAITNQLNECSSQYSLMVLMV